MILAPVAHLKPAARQANAHPPAVALRPHVFRRDRDSAGTGASCNAWSAASGVPSRHAAPGIVARRRWLPVYPQRTVAAARQRTPRVGTWVASAGSSRVPLWKGVAVSGRESCYVERSGVGSILGVVAAGCGGRPDADAVATRGDAMRRRTWRRVPVGAGGQVVSQLLRRLRQMPDRLLHPRRRLAALASLNARRPPARVLVVCNGNIFRIPFAAVVLRRVIGPRGVQVE